MRSFLLAIFRVSVSPLASSSHGYFHSDVIHGPGPLVTMSKGRKGHIFPRAPFYEKRNQSNALEWTFLHLSPAGRPCLYLPS